MLNKFLKALVLITFIFVTVVFIYTSYNTLFNDIVYEKNYFIGCGTYYGSIILALILTKNRRLNINTSMAYCVVLFNFMASILGELFNFYYRFPLWDNMLHFLAGMMISVVFLDVLYSSSSTRQISRYSKTFILLFIFFGTISVGVFWEFYEFFMDTFFNYNMQKSFMVDSTTNFYQFINENGRFVAPALVDTMNDLIIETISAFTACVIIFIYGPTRFYNNILKKKTW